LQTTTGSHLSEEMLERYAFGQLAEDFVSPLEEHMLVCEGCRARLLAVEEYLRIGAAAAKVLREPSGGGRGVLSLRFCWPRGSPLSLWATALATILLCFGLALVRPAHDLVPPASVITLEASRGASQALVSHARAGNIVLLIETSKLPALPLYKLQLVNSSGQEIWSASVSAIDQQIRVAAPQNLGAGQYWVRLYTPDSGSQLREYGLEVQ
jgi:hypothetical protein